MGVDEYETNLWKPGRCGSWVNFASNRTNLGSVVIKVVLEEMDGLDGVEYGIEHLALQCSGKGMVDIYRHKGVRSYLAHCRNLMKENIYFRNICR